MVEKAIQMARFFCDLILFDLRFVFYLKLPEEYAGEGELEIVLGCCKECKKNWAMRYEFAL
jgi:hypothetical protein